MRITLKQRWDVAKAKIEKAEKDFIDSYQGDKYTEFFEVRQNGDVVVSKVINILYSENRLTFWLGLKERPSTQQVEQIELVADNPINFKEENIRFQYKTQYPDHYVSGSYSLIQIDTYPMLFTDKKLAEELSIEIKNKLAQEQEKIDAGTHERCQRCGRLTETNQIVQHLIFGGDQRGMKTMMRFCSGTCAGHEQMSREG